MIKGGSYSDNRGIVNFNNSFDLTEIKRIYTIQNVSLSFYRGWQGHQVEQRWFSAISGLFEIYLIAVDNWEKPSKNLKLTKYNLNSNNMNVLHVPSGYISCIKSNEKNSILLAMSDYALGEIDDNYKFDIEYFRPIVK